MHLEHTSEHFNYRALEPLSWFLSYRGTIAVVPNYSDKLKYQTTYIITMTHNHLLEKNITYVHLDKYMFLFLFFFPFGVDSNLASFIQVNMKFCFIYINVNLTQDHFLE